MKGEVSMTCRGRSRLFRIVLVALTMLTVTAWMASVIRIPKWNKSERFMHETTAIRAIQTIHQMEVQYQARTGHYACSLGELASADLIGSDLASGAKHGYEFTLACSSGGYVITAVPEVYGTSGTRTFYSDESMIIRQNYGPEPAKASSSPTP